MTDTTASDLSNRSVLFLARNGVEEPELKKPLEALKSSGARVTLLSPQTEPVVALRGDWDRGEEFPVDGPLSGASADDYDALVLPGGTLNADALRADDDAVRLVKEFAAAGKPIAAICHAPWVLIEAGLTDGLRMTSYSSLRSDLVNAGADWVDEEVVTDKGITTSRTPDDLEAFIGEIRSRLA
ncbi:type 1 glutamine amidotransferase [Brachybacterium sp. EF45031]|uniref:type 1 glutamine amidotransferase domain-containing protein n=1 Tax=Brachybacterium sillae TaxID=2810536 RepID=UPI00217DB570|nr:type 1 glutamine amidotransferase domain-containing protein [Brachybacterium sillae]MCS6711530.1 type 1 glutamine amidotransferase [Brachybacterium sillae]